MQTASRELFSFFFLEVYLFLQTLEGREKERERNICWVPLVHTPTKDQICNPVMCPDGELNR